MTSSRACEIYRGCVLVVTILVAALAVPVGAQPTDSTRAMAGVEVRGDVQIRPGVERVPVAGLLARDPVNVADAARLVPSATASTNSRGETLVSIRGAGERQTAVLLDGAPLTVPWDRRVDLALIPAGVVGSLDVVRGPASLQWGPNTTGGALDIVPRSLGRDGLAADVDATVGAPARGGLGVSVLGHRGAWSGVVAVDGFARRGTALASPLAFSQPDGALRTNSDRRTASALARAVWEPSRDAQVAMTVLHLDARQGVPPEGHLDPDTERVRFWRISDWRHTTAVVRARVPVRSVALDATTWASAFDQTIRQFPDESYTAPDGGQRDQDHSAGARLVASASGPTGTMRAIAWGSASSHREHDVETEGENRFRSAEGRLAVEVERAVGAASVLTGVSFDGLSPTRADGRELGGGFAVAGGVARVEAPVGAAVLHAGIARGGRTPTMRELYGESLGRFALNPDLRAETTWQTEAGASWSGTQASIRGAVFARRTTDTIEPAVLADGRRQRVNLGSSRALGLEVDAAVRLGIVRLDASATVMHLAATDGDGVRTRLAERPGALGRLALSMLPAQGVTGAAEVLATGPAVSFGPMGEVRLPGSVHLSARLGYRWLMRRGRVDASVRLDNAMNAAIFPQAGLPAPGREVRASLRWSGWSRG